MALKGKWTDKTDGIDIASAEDINSVAHAVLELEDEIKNVSGVYVGSGEMPEGVNVQVDPDGDATVVEVGDTTTLEPNSDAFVESSVVDGKVVLNFGIPRGEDGNSANRPWVRINEGKDTPMQDVVTFEFAINKQYTELYVEGEILISTTSAAKTIYMRVCKGTTPIGVGSAIPQTKNEDKVFFRAHGTISPSGGCVFEVAASKVNNTANSAVNPGSPVVTEGSFNGLALNIMTSDPSNFKIGAGSVIKIWGR